MKITIDTTTKTVSISDCEDFAGIVAAVTDLLEGEQADTTFARLDGEGRDALGCIIEKGQRQYCRYGRIPCNIDDPYCKCRHTEKEERDRLVGSERVNGVVEKACERSEKEKDAVCPCKEL